MTRNDTKGQALLEAAITLPILVLLLLGSYVSCRVAFLNSAAESAARFEAIRSGRNLTDSRKPLAETVLPDGKSVTIRSDAGGGARLLPAPFPALAGRSTGIVEVAKAWREAGAVASFPDMMSVRTAEMSVDCWGQDTSSGKKVRRTIQGIVLVQAVR